MKVFVLLFLMIYISFFAHSTPYQETKKNTIQTIQDTHKTAEEIKQPNDKDKTTVEEAKQNEHEKKEEAPKPEKLLKIGNLAFPVAQQPTPLISFGQTLIAESQWEVQESASQIKGKNAYFVRVESSIIYAFKDNVSIFIDIPDAVRFKQGKRHTSGIEDVLIQFEYAPYTKEFYTYYDQISIVANVTIPTGSVKKNPRTGTGSNSFFIGSVYSLMSINWFFFTSYGGIFHASSHRTQSGNQFLYQYGVGRRIFNNSEWLFDWMLEFDGTYSCRNKIHGTTDRNSGGNILVVTPSLFLSCKKNLVIQLGIGFPIVQQLFGHQDKLDYLLQTKVSWNF